MANRWNPTDLNFDNEPLKRSDFADRLESFLTVDHIFVPGSLVVSLEAPFGSGKSVFLSMWAKRLKLNYRQGSDTPVPVLLNAWEDDFAGNPFLSLISNLIKAVEELDIGDDEQTADLRDAAAKAGWYLTGVANSFVRSKVGVDFASGAKLAEEKTEDAEKRNRADLVKEFEAMKAALESLKKLLRSILGSNSEIKAIVCVDELDRCRPDYAIAYLETIKHIFDIPGIAFVLAIDKGQLENSARCLFGQDLKTEEYLRKFVHRRIYLPRPSPEDVKDFVESCVSRFVVVPGVRDSRLSASELHASITKICIGFGLSLRQIESVFRTLGHLFYTETSRGELFPAFNYASMFLVCLQAYDSKTYEAFRNRDLTVAELFKKLLPVLGWNSAEMYVGTCYYGQPEHMILDGFREYLKQNDLLDDTGSSNDEQRARRRERLESNLASSWGDFGEEPLERVFKNIETASTFP
jgi:hypothetical protein